MSVSNVSGCLDLVLIVVGAVNLPSDISHILARLEGLTYLGVANTGMLFDVHTLTLSLRLVMGIWQR
jgi:hypothetical protein